MSDGERFRAARDYFDVISQDNHDLALRVVGAGDAEDSLTFAQLARRASQVANLLVSRGVRPGDRILLMLGNVVPLWEAMLAAIKLGAVIIPATTLLERTELRVPRPRSGHLEAEVYLKMRAAQIHTTGADMIRASILAAILTLLPLVASAELKKDAPTVLITGANRGIGLELATQYADKGWNVIATSRHVAGDPALAALTELAGKHPQVVLEKLDVSDTGTIHTLAEKYHDQPVDVVINNAANVEATFAADMAIANTPFEKLDFDAARRDFDVNTLGAMRVAQAFLPNVEHSKQKKIVSVTSSAGSFGNPLPNGIAMNYGASKAALNKYMTLLAVQMQSRGVIVALVQPIFVASKADLVGKPSPAPLDKEVGKLVKVIDALTAQSSGKITNFSTGKTDPF